MASYNTQGITSSFRPRARPQSRPTGLASKTSASSASANQAAAKSMLSVGVSSVGGIKYDPTANDDDNVATSFISAGAILPAPAPGVASKIRETNSAFLYDRDTFKPYVPDNSADIQAYLGNSAVEDALLEAMGPTPQQEIYVGQMPDEEPEPNIDMSVLQGALQPDRITVTDIDVKQGDTLSALARENGLSILEILNANPSISDPDMILTGEKIKIPKPSDPRFAGVPKPLGVPDSPRLSDITVDPTGAIAGTDPRNLGGAEGYGPATADAGLMSKPYDSKAMEDINNPLGDTKVVAANVDFDFIKKREGYKKTMYVPVDSKGKVLGKSGPTIASGFDLGQRSEADLKGLPVSLIAKLKPYLGKRGSTSDTYVKANPLTLTSDEVDDINKFAKKQEVNRLKEDWEGSTSTLGFDDLTEAQATVVASVAFQYGDLPTKAPTFWKHVTNGDWDKAEAELRAFGDKYSTRRTAEADFLAGN